MPEEKARVGFSLDFKDSKAQIDALVQALEKAKKGFKDTGKEGTESLNKVNLGMKSVFQNITALSSSLRKSISSGQKMSRSGLKATLDQAKALETRISKIHSKTVQKYVKSEGEKRKALKATLRSQEQAANQLSRISKTTEASLEKQKAGYGALASILSVKLGSVLRNLVKDSALLAARNEVLGTAMRTVGNNAGISNSELERTEMTVRKLGISINDTRELISRFAQAQLGMENTTKLARAAQDLAAGSTLGSSEALRIMTQSILSLLPRQLRQFGVVVNLNQVYQEQSRILGKSVTSLTSLEKRQGLLNKIFEEAAKRAGAYERSMEDSGKVLTTLTSRIIPDTLSMLGEQFLPVLEALVFGFKDLLEWVQNQEGGFKTFISTILAVGAAVTTVVGSLTVLSGITGAATGGFTGFAKSASTTLAGLGPLAIGIAAVTTALILLPKLLGDSATAQEKLTESSKEALNIQLTRLKGLEDLQNVLKNQALTEEDVAKIIRGSVGRHKELIPLLNKEGLTRQEVVDILAEYIKKQKELVALRKGEAKKALEANIKELKDEQFALGQLVQKARELEKANKSVNTSVTNFTGLLGVLATNLAAPQEALENLSNFFQTGLARSLEDLSKELKATDAQIEVLSQDLENEFGTAAKKTQQSASDMQQALLGLEASYDKLQKKALKKFPFKALAQEQVEELEKIDKALQNGLITQEQAAKGRLQINAVSQSKFEAAERKFQAKLDTIGKTALQKIEAKRQQALKINEGSAKAIEAIDIEAADARNAVYEKMWEERLSVVQESTDSLIQVMRNQRVLATNELNQETEARIAKERLSTEEIVDARMDFHDRALALLRSSQEEERGVRQQHFDAIAMNIETLFNTGVINEEQFNAKSKALAVELNSFREQQINERADFLKSALDKLHTQEVSLHNKLKSLDEQRLSAMEDTQETLRKLRQKGLTDAQVFAEERKRATKLLTEGEIALQEGKFDKVKKITAQIKDIALSTSDEISESGKKDAEVLISADKARVGSMKLVKKAGDLLARSLQSQSDDTAAAIERTKAKTDELGVSLDVLAEERKVNIEVVAEAAKKQIDSIQGKLNGLKDKTVTITVITRNLSVGGATGGVTGGGAEAAAGGPVAAAGGEGFANGAVDIKGPGTSLSDSIVAFLSRGESVINSAATQMFKPILEMMNTNPEALRSMLAPKIAAARMGAGGVGTSESTTIGDLNITVNGVDSNDVQNINWRKVVRQQIAPELKKLTKRRAVI